MPWLPHAGAGTYEFSLLTPRLESVSATFVPPGPSLPLPIHVDVQYDSLGAATLAGTVNGVPFLCNGRVAAKAGRATYHFTLRDPSNSGRVLTLTGVSTSDVVRLTYAGPPMPVRGLHPVTINADSTVSASIVTTPSISAKNVITGSGTVETGFATNMASPGTLKGKVSSKGLVWVVKQGARTARFQGKRVGDSFVGTLRLVAKPAVETHRNVSIPASDFSLSGGVATFRGTLVFVGEKGPVSANGATITVLSDLDDNGSIVGKERVQGTASADGRYEMKFNVMAGRPVRMQIHHDDFADTLASYPSVAPGSIVTKNAAAISLDSLTVTQGTAASADENIRFEDLPPSIPALSARVFDPALESAQFPGAFSDGQAGFLVAGVFAAIEGRDTQGHAVTNIGAEVKLSLLVPTNSWPVLGDEIAGNGRIDVPFYFYDQELARWIRSSSVGWLENRARNPIAESELAALRSGAHSEDVFAACAVSRFGYWSMAWLGGANTAVRGAIVDPNGDFLAGATVELRGASYSGRSSPVVTSEDGRFCVEMLRSELAGEDLDRDGNSNEMHQVTIVVRWNTNVFAFGPVTAPTAAVACGSGAETMAGTLMLSESNRLTASFCTVTGQVVYSGQAIGEVPQLLPGEGVPQAFVSIVDPDALDATGCTDVSCVSTVAGTNGMFSLVIPMMSEAGLHVSSHSVAGGAIGSFRARANLTNCPVAPLSIEADYVNFGFFVCQIFDSQADIGVITIIDSMLDVYVAGTFNVVGEVPETEVPKDLGLWITVPLQIGDFGGPEDGTITFTVTQLNPIGGTWQRMSPSGNSSGGWIQVLVGP